VTYKDMTYLEKVQQTMEKLKAESSAVPAAVEEIQAVAPVASAVAAEAAPAKASAGPSSVSSSSTLVSHPAEFSPTFESDSSIRRLNPKYINKYGDVLYRINRDKVNLLAKSRRPKNKAADSENNEARTLSGPMQSVASPSSDNSKSFSRITFNGRTWKPEDFNRGFAPERTYNLRTNDQRQASPWGKWNPANVQTLNFSPRFGRF